MMLAEIDGNLVIAAVGVAFTILTGLIGWLTWLAKTLAEMRSDLRHLVERTDQMGKDSVTRNEGVLDRLSLVEQRVHGLELDLARWHPKATTP